MKNRELKVLNVILGKLGKTSDPIGCWEISGRVLDLEKLVDQLKKAEEEPAWIGKYLNERNKLVGSLRKYVGEAQDPFGNKIERYEPKDEKSEAEFQSKLKELEEKYKEDLSKEAVRSEKIRELLEKEVGFDMDPLEYEWCFEDKKSLISANEMAFLRKYSLLVKPETDKKK